MVEHKSHKVRKSNLPKEKLIYRTTNKSIYLIAVSFALAGTFAISQRNYYVAAFWGFLGLLEATKKDKTIFEGTKRYFVVYDQEDDRYVSIYYLSEVDKWVYHFSYLNPKIEVFLKDNDVFIIDKGVDHTMKRYFYKVLKKKAEKI